MAKKVLIKRTPTGHKLSVNIEGIGDVTRRYPAFLRWDRHNRIDGPGGFFGRLTVNAVNYAGTQIYDQGWFDANYELVDPLPSGASAYIFECFSKSGSLTSLPDLSGVNMKVTWTGGAGISSVTFGGDANNNTAVNLGGRFATFTFKASSTAPQGGNCTDNSWITFNFSGTEPPRSIRVFEAVNEAAVVAGDIFDPSWLTAVSAYDILRLMDPAHTNGSAAVDYADLATESFAHLSQTLTTSGRKVGIPVSVMAALANQSGRPIWVCIPHQFTDAAVTSLATALRDAVSASIPIYVEYSNETWNGGFTQAGYCQTQGAGISAWSGDSASTKGLKWAGLRQAQVCSIFRNVFGANSGNRWIGVLGTQLGNAGVITARLVGVDYFLDPANALLRAGDTVTTLFTHMAGAPYFGPTPSTTASGTGQTMKPWVDAADQAAFNASMYDQIKAAAASSSPWLNIAWWRGQWQSHIATAAGRGLTLIMYEGGNGSVAVNPLRDNLSGETDGTAFNLALAKFADSAEAGLLHTEMYALYLADGGLKPNKYNVISPHNKFGPWGARQGLSDNNLCYQALAAFNGT